MRDSWEIEVGEEWEKVVGEEWESEVGDEWEMSGSAELEYRTFPEHHRLPLAICRNPYYYSVRGFVHKVWIPHLTQGHALAVWLFSLVRSCR